MGGWGKLSLSSTAVYLDGLPVPYVTADNVVVDGLFARVAIAGTNSTRRYEYTRLSSSSRHHPLAKVAAVSSSAAGPGSGTDPNDSTAGDGVCREADQSETTAPEVVLLRR
ncbi:unnamed protein product, partial [Ectocarpus sp. 12 AP-2014]